jgi:preprotein translocase subunit SecA
LEDNLMRLFGSERIAKLMDKMGMEEGEVIQHSMITSSIERAQKKVEENNFGIRKRLLEYDDVMNAQREVVYRRRRNALFGERLELDILNLIYDVAEDIAAGNKTTNDYASFKLAVVKDFGYETHISQQEFAALPAPALTQKLYDEAVGYYDSKNEHIGSNAMPMITDLLRQNTHYENVAIPFTDGRKHTQVIANLHRAQATNGLDIVRQMEKGAVLSTIDDAWTQHLRQMDDLKQVVQNAVYEQKDPLLVYKFEAFELFKRMLGKVNHETANFLFYADVPVAAEAGYAEPALYFDDEELPLPSPQPKLKVEKAASDTSLGAGQEDIDQAAELGLNPQVLKQEPIRSQKVANRNDKVTVQYMDGTMKRDVKYKTVEEDLAAQRCVLVEEA